MNSASAIPACQRRFRSAKGVGRIEGTVLHYRPRRRRRLREIASGRNMTEMARFACAAAALMLFFAPHVRAAEAGDELTISIITIEPGDEIFEKFGHNAIRVQDAFSGTDLLYNYGVFDFFEHNFVIKFLKG